jgi:HAD superfamily hydrolase (TIGR01509 family)
MTRAVIFDVDGTLVDTNDLHAAAWEAAFRQFGHAVPAAEIRGQIGKGGDQLMPVFLPPEVVEREGEAIAEARSALFLRDYIGRARAFPGVRPLFERLRAEGQRILLASSAKGEELERYKEIARIADLVDAATSADDADRSKPHPDIFAAALDRLKPLPPAAAIVVGDSPYDAEAAGKAGLRCLGLLCGGFPGAVLREAGCIALYRDPAALLADYARSPLATG